MLVTNKSRVNAYSLPGGHIFVSDAMIAAFMSVVMGMILYLPKIINLIRG